MNGTNHHRDTRGTEAHASAVQLLKARHLDEWEALHRTERSARGLTPVSDQGESTATIMAKLDRVRQREAAYIEALSARGVDAALLKGAKP